MTYRIATATCIIESGLSVPLRLPIVMDHPALLPRASPRLDNLPLDIMIQIQQHVDARDIITLRKSCKGLHAATQQRTVWLNALRRMCWRHGVFAPSFPLEYMSIKELEHASLAPSRISSLIHKGALRSFVTRILEPRTPSIVSNVKTDLKCESTFLIPGGRFLVVNSYCHGICLWDLGIHAGKVPEFSPVDVIQQAGYEFLCTGPTRDGLGIVIVSYLKRWDDRTLVAHEIYPCTSNPKFACLGSIKYPNRIDDIDIPALSGELLVFKGSPSCIVVWNISLGAAVAWSYSESIYDNILISGDSIILVQEFKLSVWDIPPLLPLSKGDCKIVTHSPKYEVTHPFSSKGWWTSSVLSPWFSRINTPILFVIFGENDDQPIMVCYTLISITSSMDPTLPMVLPIKTGTALGLPAEAIIPTDIDICGCLQYCENELCRISLSGTQLMISLVTPPTSLNDVPPITSNLFNCRSDPLSCSFCAVSGRVVVVEAGCEDIRIMDYLAPPPS